MLVFRVILRLIQGSKVVRPVVTKARIVRGTTNPAKVHQIVKNSWESTTKSKPIPITIKSSAKSTEAVLPSDLRHLVIGSTNAREVSLSFRNAWQMAKLTK